MTRTLAALGLAMVFLSSGCTCWSDFHTVGKGGSGGTGGSGGSGGVPTLCTPGEVVGCYSGPPETRGQGECHDGTQTCAADGQGYGACVGEQLPQMEECGSPKDEDCDGLAPACEGLCLWNKAFGDEEAQAGTGVALDSKGDAVIIGTLFGTANLGGGSLASSGKSDVLVAKLAGTDGAHVWSKVFGDASDQWAMRVAIDSAGDVIVAGQFAGTIDFGGGPLTSKGFNDVFVVKLAGTDGAHVWSKAFGDSSGQGAASVATDVNGDVIVVGGFNGTMDFGGGALTSAGGNDIFVVKLAGGDGAHLWSTAFGDASFQGVTSLAIDPAGDALMAGTFSGTVDFGAGPITSSGDDIFVVKLAGTDGAYQWSKTLGDNSFQVATGLAVDSSGNVIVVGEFSGTVDFGAGSVTSAGDSDIFVMKLAGGDGAHVWSRASFEGDADQVLRDVAVDSSGNVLLTGEFTGTVDFGDGPLTAIKSDVFVAKLGPDDGKHVWSKKFGKEGIEDGASVVTDAQGNVFLTGSFEAVNFGCGPLAAVGLSDGFLVKLSP